MEQQQSITASVKDLTCYKSLNAIPDNVWYDFFKATLQYECSDVRIKQ